MFRNFDNHDVYFDLRGNVLHGAVQFNLKDGSTPAQIFDSDYTPIANPQLLDAYGKTEQQVFVNADVRAFFYQYVGQGPMASAIEEDGIDVSDESTWRLLYTVESAAIDERSVSGESAMGIPNIDALRSLDPGEVPEIYGKKIVCVHGYYEAGDCEPVWYVWDAQSMLSDDNGSVIQGSVELTGRWILVQPTEHCDSRHFGIFPQDSEDAEIDHSTRITQLISYCNTHSIRPYFNGSQGYPYFIYTNAVYNSRNAIDVSDDVVFIDKGTRNLFYGEWNGNPYFYNANTTVNSVTVRNSWHFKNYGPDTVHYVVDDNSRPVLLNGIDVKLEVSPASGSQFTDCEMESNEKITGNVVMQNMTVRTDWFSDSYNWTNLQLSNCRVLLDNCKNANVYVVLKNKMHDYSYGDLGEQELSNVTLGANCIAENGSFSNVTITGNTELHNISGTVNIVGQAYGLNFIDCWITVTNDSDIVLESVQWRRGAVSFAQGHTIRTLQTLYLDGVDVNATFYTQGMRPQYIGCSVNAVQANFRDVQYVDCRINANIVQYPETYTYDPLVGPAQYMAGEFVGNKFLNGSAIFLTPIQGADYSSAVVGVIGSYCNNYSDHNFVDDSNWSGVSRSSIHVTRMKYEGNTGGCPVSEVTYWGSLPYIDLWQPGSPESYRTVPSACEGATGLWVVNDWRSGGERDIATSVYWVLNMNAVPLDVSNLFRLKYLRTVSYLQISAEVQSFIRTENNGFYMQNFTVHSPMVQSNVRGTDSTAYVTLPQPCRFEYVGDRLYTNDDIDKKRSALWFALYELRDDATRFNANVKYTYSFSNL